MTKLRLKTAAIIYGTLAAAAVAIGVIRGAPNILLHPDGALTAQLPPPVRVGLGTAIGIVFGLSVACGTRYSVYRYHWARSLHQEFRGLFGPITGRDIFGFAAISAVAEELFFRGALQPVLGIFITSTVFGLLHIAPNKRLVLWTVQALAMGFALGGLFYLTGDIAAPIAAHFVINYQNLHFINRYDPSPEMPRTFKSMNRDPGSPHLVSRHPR